MIYALDSNIISYMLKDDQTVYDNFEKAVQDGQQCIIPPIVYYEVKRGLLFVGATVKAAAFDVLCREFGIGEMSVSVWNEAARLYADLRKKGRLIEDADLFIAAFCIAGGFTLVTNNEKHFDGVTGIKILNWTKAP